MKLPFSPTFFKKLDIYQNLIEYNSTADKKTLWEGEMAVLIWASSEHHQHEGSPIDALHVKNAMEYSVNAGCLLSSDYNRLVGSTPHILENLVTKGYGEYYGNPLDKIRIKVNREGILAGKILRETGSLKNSQEYKKWLVEWWFIYYLAGILLVLQTLQLFLDLIERLFNT